MAQPNAVVTIDSVVHVIPGTATPNVPSEEKFSLSTTLTNYTTDLNAYTNGIWVYLVGVNYSTPVTTTQTDQLVQAQNITNAGLQSIDYIIKIQNVTAPAPPYQQSGFVPEKEDRFDGIIGPADFTGPVDLAAVYVAAVAKARSFTNY